MVDSGEDVLFLDDVPAYTVGYGVQSTSRSTLPEVIKRAMFKKKNSALQK